MTRTRLATAAVGAVLAVALAGCGDQAALRAQQARAVQQLCAALLARGGASAAYVAAVRTDRPDGFSFADGTGRTSVPDDMRAHCDRH